MANFEPKKLDLDDINGGIRFTESDGITPNAINDPIEAVAYSQTVVEHLTDTPDTSEIDGVGSPNVSFVSSTTADGVTIYKFKFSNLSGATFTPSLDEAGNLSWSNNRNLPNPPTINISGRDYLFSSEVLSGTYIPQVNSEVTDIPLTSFNRAPVDDIDHCYLFYYYTPENIYYWLATQVVDIQETTATLKILSVVRLTGYTPTIGENGNWFIGGEDTGKPSYGASGVTDVVAGASYNQGDFTITPLTFNFEVGNSKTVNVKAAVGNVEDGSYAKLAQVVRTDSAQSLSEAQKQQGQANLGLDEKYAKQDGTYPNLSAGKATADGSGNNISDTYAKLPQVVRTDSLQALNRKQYENFILNSTPRVFTSLQTSEPTWKTVGKLNNYGLIRMTVATTINGVDYTEAEFILSVSYRERASITQIGNSEGSLISAIRLRGDSSANMFIDLQVSNPNPSSPTIVVWFDVRRNNSSGYFETVDFETFSGNDGDYAITTLALNKKGISTTGGVYQNGSPVLVGAAPTWVTGTSGSLTLPSAGWYVVGTFNNTASEWLDNMTFFYWDGASTLFQALGNTRTGNGYKMGALRVKSDGVMTTESDASGSNTPMKLSYYRFA